jgi:hypothetical protein
MTVIGSTWLPGGVLSNKSVLGRQSMSWCDRLAISPAPWAALRDYCPQIKFVFAVARGPNLEFRQLHA